MDTGQKIAPLPDPLRAGWPLADARHPSGDPYTGMTAPACRSSQGWGSKTGVSPGFLIVGPFPMAAKWIWATPHQWNSQPPNDLPVLPWKTIPVEESPRCLPDSEKREGTGRFTNNQVTATPNRPCQRRSGPPSNYSWTKPVQSWEPSIWSHVTPLGAHNLDLTRPSPPPGSPSPPQWETTCVERHCAKYCFGGAAWLGNWVDGDGDGEDGPAEADQVIISWFWNNRTEDLLGGFEEGKDIHGDQHDGVGGW